MSSGMWRLVEWQLLTFRRGLMPPSLGSSIPKMGTLIISTKPLWNDSKCLQFDMALTAQESLDLQGWLFFSKKSTGYSLGDVMRLCARQQYLWEMSRCQNKRHTVIRNPIIQSASLLGSIHTAPANTLIFTRRLGNVAVRDIEPPSGKGTFDVTHKIKLQLSLSLISTAWWRIMEEWNNIFTHS